MSTPSPISRVHERLNTPVDSASLGAFRILFGGLLCLAVVRFWAKGGIHDAFIAPKFFFPYSGFEWIRPLPGQGMYALYALMGLLALFFALGFHTRLCAGLLTLLFTWAHLCDKANYLNHYYQITLLLFLCTLLPVGASLSMDAARSKRPAPQIPIAALWLLRFQVGAVYFFGGIAKLGTDWLLRGEPLGTWLRANQDFPMLGPIFQLPHMGLMLSWMGTLYDLSIPFLLLHRKTRAFALGLVILFHLITAGLFQIGLFPWIMIASSSLFLPPEWPQKILGRIRRVPENAIPKIGYSLPRWAIPLLGAWVCLHSLLPLRFLLYPGPLLWNEDGYRFSFRVMVMEKTGSVDFTLRDPRGSSRQSIRARDYLSPFQIKMMSTQVDMMVAFAQYLARGHAERTGIMPQVFAHSFVSLNGRPPTRYIRPEVDLAAQSDSWNAPLLSEPPADMAPGGAQAFSSYP